MRALAVVLALWPIGALAQEFPQLYDVIDVAAGDVLNVRAEPDAASGIIGEIAFDAKGVEVTSAPQDGWAPVNSGEQAGWVAERYLQRDEGYGWGASGEFGMSPHPMYCFGTEPFWSLAISDGDMLTYEAPGEAVEGNFARVLSSAGPMRRGFVGYLDDGRELTGIIRHEACSDGMSDRQFGLGIDVILFGPEQTELVTGCCSLRR